MAEHTPQDIIQVDGDALATATRPIFRVRGELDLLVDGRQLVELTATPEATEWLQTLHRDGFTQFTMTNAEQREFGVVPDDFVPFGRRLNAAGEERFGLELWESIQGIEDMLGAICRAYGKAPSAELKINDFGFLRSNARAEMIPPYVLDRELRSGLAAAQYVHSTISDLLSQIVFDHHAAEFQRAAARTLLERRQGA